MCRNHIDLLTFLTFQRKHPDILKRSYPRENLCSRDLNRFKSWRCYFQCIFRVRLFLLTLIQTVLYRRGRQLQRLRLSGRICGDSLNRLIRHPGIGDTNTCVLHREGCSLRCDLYFQLPFINIVFLHSVNFVHAHLKAFLLFKI